jgi:predicted tellurium resistance membrane protein TerC
VRVGQLAEAILYTLPNCAFIYLFGEFYLGRAKQKRALLLGLLGALFPSMLSLVLIAGWILGWTQPAPAVSDHQFPIYLPIPSLLLVSLVLMKLFPLEGEEDI